jgi:glyoxylase-like metal-dependent hydrolase (beta-lactamase superfamily II)
MRCTFPIHRIEVPTPFEVGTVNVYLLESEALTLIDTGPKTSQAVNALEQGLKEIGYSIEELDRVVITHGHLDHLGLANMIKVKVRSNASIYVHARDAIIVSHFESEVKRYITLFEEFSIRSGVPRDLLVKVVGYFKAMVGACESVEVDFLVDDGDSIDLNDLKLRVIHTPGHSPGSLCLYLEDYGILFSGDTLLKDITPNPSITPEDGGLLDYLKSLSKLQELNIEVVFPGHGEMIENHREVIQKILKHHQLRENQVLEALSSSPKSIFEISKTIFGELPVSEVLLGVREIAGHLEILKLENKLEIIHRGGIDYYMAKEV